MGREIKFRVWSEEDKEYRKDCRLLSLFDCVTGCPATIYNNEGDRFDIEQYTGVKDKKGKEIYERDIVTEHNGDVIGEIIQAPSGEWRIKWIGIFGGSSSLFEHRDLCEVIGHIHEQPKDFRPEHLRRMGVTISKGGEKC